MRAMLVGLVVVTMAACSGPHDEPAHAPTAVASAASVAPAVPTVPHNPADMNAWREFASSAAPPVPDGQHVYSFVVPAGSTADAKEQREKIAGAIKGLIGRGNPLPGNAIVIAGPDGNAAAEVVVATYKDEPKDAFKGMTVRFVADAATDVTAARAAVEAAGGTFDWVKTRAG